MFLKKNNVIYKKTGKSRNVKMRLLKKSYVILRIVFILYRMSTPWTFLENGGFR